MFTLFLRALILYVVMIVTMRGLGKRQLGQFQPYEFAMTILLADLISTPMGSVSTPLLYGILPFMALFTVHSLITLLSLKSDKVRAIVSGKPSVIISRGRHQRRGAKAPLPEPCRPAGRAARRGRARSLGGRHRRGRGQRQTERLPRIQQTRPHHRRAGREDRIRGPAPAADHGWPRAAQQLEAGGRGMRRGSRPCSRAAVCARKRSTLPASIRRAACLCKRRRGSACASTPTVERCVGW